MKKFLDITLCIVDCKNYDNAAKSIIHCATQCNIEFKRRIYFSDIKHYKLDEYGIEFIKIDKISSAREYDNFMIKDFGKFIDSNHALIVQHDGIIYQPEKWNDDFLNYDYIGAPWPASPKNGNRVGNGGFSLRSKKFIDRNSELLGDKYCNEAEDVYIACTNYHILKNEGFKYASPELASTFSYEQPHSIRYEGSFGFHLAACASNDEHKNFRNKVYENLHKNW